MSDADAFVAELLSRLAKSLGYDGLAERIACPEPVRTEGAADWLGLARQWPPCACGADNCPDRDKRPDESPTMRRLRREVADANRNSRRRPTGP
ncbi:hypothetical protein [Streptomyces sp. 8L]|uniref:hypothetical protein n=1 Tax=Streptomyces sp. 8L TaxID=2877242 RepID=UPI001CD36805|nr:hypothetical protein [Streptomyces sp. 8L]MCA1220458.1 hypothetical protein [Streptomyces sp. 8L]